MYELDASKHHEAMTILQQAISMADGRQRPPQLERMTRQNADSSLALLQRIKAAITTLHVPVTKLTLLDLQKNLVHGALTYMECGTLLLNLSQTLCRELQSIKVFP